MPKRPWSCTKWSGEKVFKLKEILRVQKGWGSLQENAIARTILESLEPAAWLRDETSLDPRWGQMETYLLKGQKRNRLMRMCNKNRLHMPKSPINLLFPIFLYILYYQRPKNWQKSLCTLKKNLILWALLKWSLGRKVRRCRWVVGNKKHSF